MRKLKWGEERNLTVLPWNPFVSLCPSVFSAARDTREELAMSSLSVPGELFRDPTHVHSEAKTIKPRPESPSSLRMRDKAILMIGERENAYFRENVRDYLAFATSIEARKHEERRPSEEILDGVHTRSKELALIQSRNGTTFNAA